MPVLGVHRGARKRGAAAGSRPRACSQAIAIDISEAAVARITENAAGNGLSNVQARAMDASDELRELERRGERFGMIVLDREFFMREFSLRVQRFSAEHESHPVRVVISTRAGRDFDIERMTTSNAGVALYTREEKLEIARRYLLPRRRKEAGLSEQQFIVPDETLEAVVRRYTRESGVRELERTIGRLARKVALALLGVDAPLGGVQRLAALPPAGVLLLEAAHPFLAGGLQKRQLCRRRALGGAGLLLAGLHGVTLPVQPPMVVEEVMG